MCRWLKYMSCIKRPPQALGMSCHGQCRSPFHNNPGINSGFAGARMALKRSRNKNHGNTKRGCARILKILPGKNGFLHERSTFSLHWPANEKGDPLSDLMQTFRTRVCQQNPGEVGHAKTIQTNVKLIQHTYRGELQIEHNPPMSGQRCLAGLIR